MANEAKSTKIIRDDDDCYDMNYKNRGLALIFHHIEFESPFLRKRTGTEKDLANLKSVFETLQFEIKDYEDITFSEIKSTLDAISQMDHSDNDCLAVVVSTHGGRNKLLAYDKSYDPREIWTPFYSDSCPTLEGKPKLFFIQACRGDSYDYGVEINQNYGTFEEIKNDKPPNSLRIADMVVMNSSYSGFVSCRNSNSVSWFIQVLCSELREKNQNNDLLTMLTSVAFKVAFNKIGKSKDGRLAKQMPTIFTTLTKELYFTKKV